MNYSILYVLRNFLIDRLLRKFKVYYLFNFATQVMLKQEKSSLYFSEATFDLITAITDNQLFKLNASIFDASTFNVSIFNVLKIYLTMFFGRVPHNQSCRSLNV